MRLAKREDKEMVVNILTASFKDYKHTNWVLRTDLRPERLKNFYNYLFDETIEIGEIYINEDNNAVALWNSNKKDHFNIRIILAKLRLLLKMGIPTLIRLIELEKLLYEKFPKKSDYYHLHLLAVLPEFQGKGHAKKLLFPVLEEMNTKEMPIYLETAAQMKVKFYNKIGFSSIHVQRHGEFDVHIMKTTANKSQAVLS